MYKGLFLDDERNPEDVTWDVLGTANALPTDTEWTIVRTFADFKSAIHGRNYDYYSFDHDIQDFYEVLVGEEIGETLFGTVYADHNMVREHTGYHAALHLLDCLDDCNPPLGIFIHSRNPVGAMKIYSVLKNIC